jgi:membrane protein DedA with SNARE-associated domain
MLEFFNNIGLLASQNQFLAYFIIYIATIFLGNISAFAGFWIVFQGTFGAWGVPLLILTIFAADLSGDLLWYSLGRTLRDTRFGNFIKNHLPRHERMEKSLQKNGGKWVFMSKFIYASSFPILFMVGWAGMAFKKFIKIAVLGILTWLPILTALTYGLIYGLSPLRAATAFKRLEVVFVVGLVLFLTADYVLAKLLKLFFGKLWKEDENGNGDGNVEDKTEMPRDKPPLDF